MYQSDDDRKLQEAWVSEFIVKTFKKLECKEFRTAKNDTELCECGYSKQVHSSEVPQTESNQQSSNTEDAVSNEDTSNQRNCTAGTKDRMKESPTDAFGDLNFNFFKDEEGEDVYWKEIPYVRLDYKTTINNIMKLFRVIWKMETPNVILSFVSESGVTETTSNENIRKTICNKFVEAIASSKVWIITGGLDKGVDQLIGEEVKAKLKTEDKKLQAVLGICSWGCLGDKKSFLNDSTKSNGYAFDNNPTGFSLNHHHTHFLLVDDGTQRSGCEWKLRQEIEQYLTKWGMRSQPKMANDASSELPAITVSPLRHLQFFRPARPGVMTATNPPNLHATTEPPPPQPSMSIPLIYVLIGGDENALDLVKNALFNGIPVIIVTGTGGTADIISKEWFFKEYIGATLDRMPDTFEKLFKELENKLKQLLLDQKDLSADKVILNIKTTTKLELFLELEEKEQQLNDAAVDVDQISTQTVPDGSNTSAANSESAAVIRMRGVIKHMLVDNEIPEQNAKQVVAELKHLVLSETLANVIRAKKDLPDLLIKFDVNDSENKSINSIIVDALKTVKLKDPSVVYMLVAAWDDETIFRKLLDEKWMSESHKDVFKELLENGSDKYVEMMMTHNSESEWLTSGSILDDQFKENDMCARLFPKFNDNKTRYKSLSLRGKMLFIWCITKTMPETSMQFWKQGQDCLAMALIGYRMSKELKRKETDKEGYKYEEMNKQKLFFSNHAVNLLKACYADNKRNAHVLLDVKVEDLNESPLQIAVSANFSKFISSEPVQDLLKRIWISGIENHNKLKYVPMFMSLACPLLAPALFNFQLTSIDDKEDENQKSATDRQRQYVDGYLQRVKSFINTPFVKFTYGFISYIGYLILFSVVMLTDFRSRMGPLEKFLNFWTLILLIEEIKQAVVQKNAYVNLYNFFDMGALVTYIVGFLLRTIYHGDPAICLRCLYVARIVLSLSLTIFFIRSLQFLWIFKTIGPKIFMLRRLISDLIGFLMILIVFISAYGVVSNVIMYPNQPLNIALLHDVFYDACWSVLQQFNREETAGLLCFNDWPNASAAEYCSRTTDEHIDYVWCKKNQCPANDWIVGVLLAIYALFTGIMLLNVLIAMFNTTFAIVTENEKGVSKLQRYRLIREYSSHSMIPVPLCAITYPYKIIKYMYLFGRRKEKIKDQRSSQAYKKGADIPMESTQDKEPNIRSSKSPHIGYVKRWERVVVARYYKKLEEEKKSVKTQPCCCSNVSQTVRGQPERSKSTSAINR